MPRREQWARSAALLLDAVEHAVIVTDLDGLIIHWSAYAERLYGWTAAEVLNRPITEVTVSSATALEAQEIMKALARGERWRGEFEVRRRDGTTFIAAVVNGPLMADGELVGIVGVSSDVSAAVAARAAARRRERWMRDLFDAMDEGFCLCEMVVDDDGNPVDYRFLEINALFEEMTGLRSPVGRTALDLVPDLEKVWIDTYARVGLGRQTLRFEQESAAMGRWFEVFATPMEPYGHFSIVFKDQTARHLAQESLRESEQRFRDMTDHLPLLVWQHDVHGALTWVNTTYCEFFGVTRESMRDDRWQLLPHPDDTRYTEGFLTAVAERRPFHGEVRVRGADGRWRWLESWSQPRYGSDGTFLGHLGTSADVTARKEADLALRASAAADAYRALLSDTLRSLADPVQVQVESARILGEHLSAARVHYAEVDDDGACVTVLADYHPGVPSVRGRHRLDDHGVTVMDDFRAGRPEVVDDVSRDSRLSPAHRTATSALGVGAYVLLPLMRDGRPVAALAVHDAGPRRWTPEELTIIADTAERTWTAVARARAEEKVRVQRQRAQLTADLLSALERETTTAAQAQRLTDSLVPGIADYATLEAPYAEAHLLALTHHDGEKAEVLRRLRRHHRLGPDERYSLHRSATGGVELISQVTPELRTGLPRDEEAAGLLEKLGTRSHLAVPLALGDQRGVLMLGITEPDRPLFGDDDAAFVTDLGARVALVLASTRAREQQHHIAARLQRALLPDRLVSHPRLAIAARYRAGSALLDVGGDWYDTYTWPDGRIGVIVGDVAGHTMDSAAAMGRLRAATAALVAYTPASPGAVLDALSSCARGPNGTELVTAACIVIDPGTDTLTYATAGHPPPLVLAPGRPPRRLDDAAAPAICVHHPQPRALRPVGRSALAPGSLIVLYSDGIVERRGDTLENGIERLARAATPFAGCPISDIAEQILAAMNDDDSTEDDTVIVCVRMEE
ncbi:PAS domain S-box protein [Nucisporomicrobium flavum]|uniref:PAS domain S-box protein n=1 Tax=Nucisporomicrobium flavum TaxID=2785915 RepID=UPI0018F637F5|nr:PAS domain S-box protein [Nucisporomicrobium flavum]